ncbi:MAG: ATP-binding protein [Hominenteromicrobium sp.]|uniref:ATP-binding protein n=1 Tax=Hominenteromicrobium sp. TaxID=3073581 RepID=UPI0039A3EBC2
MVFGGAEADRDAEFVQDYCKALELHCKVIYKDIPALAAVSGEGVEECARRVRYACFAEEAGENGCIATAHNADDNAETLLLNLTRGMGPHGAGGHSAAARQNLSPDFEHFPRRGGTSL